MLPCEVWDRLGALRQEEMLAVLAAFFCLLFVAAAKKSRCRPAQGRRLKHEGIARMPAQRPEQPNRPPRPGANGHREKNRHASPTTSTPAAGFTAAASPAPLTRPIHTHASTAAAAASHPTVP